MPRINGLNAHSTHAHADYTCGLNVFCNSAVQLCAASGKKQNNFLLSNWSLLILVSKTAAFASKHKNEPCDGSKTGSHDQILTFSKNLSLDNQNYLMTAWLAKKSASWSKKLYAGKWWDMNTCALYAWIFPSLFSCSEQLRLEWGARLSTVEIICIYTTQGRMHPFFQYIYIFPIFCFPNPFSSGKSTVSESLFCPNNQAAFRVSLNHLSSPFQCQVWTTTDHLKHVYMPK